MKLERGVPMAAGKSGRKSLSKSWLRLRPVWILRPG